MPPYALFQAVNNLWVVAANEDGANYIQVLKVSNKIINKNSANYKKGVIRDEGFLDRTWLVGLLRQMQELNILLLQQ